MRWWGRVLAVCVVLAAGMGSAQAPGQKLALVIGVSDYGRERAAQEAAGFIVPPALANAVRDSELVASALESKGFTVTRVTNPDKRALLSAMNTFAATLNRAGPDAVGVFYFAGHGAQGRPALERDIDNYLIPLGADLATEVDLESEALALSRVSAALKPGPQGAVVLILDACRDFALPAASRSGMVTRGLAEARAAPGTYIAYATAPSFTALDALPGQQNGPYATALAAEVRGAQGANIEQVFIAVRNRVLEQTRNTQVPWENSSLRRSVVLGVAPAPRPDNRPVARAPTTPGTKFRDCAACPEMIVVPPGAFAMGPPTGTRQVTIAAAFGVSRTEVTFAQWDACLAGGGCADEDGPYRPDDNNWGRAQRPVINVSRDDALKYINWLNAQVGRRAYRLLTESEWEYAARAGAVTPFSTGATINPTQAHYAHGAVSRFEPQPTGPLIPRPDRTSEVGKYPANAFGLFDMHGNVWEWTQDCYDRNYAGAPVDGTAFAGSYCPYRVLRGGAWNSLSTGLAVYQREDQWPSTRSILFGFRVARTIP